MATTFSERLKTEVRRLRIRDRDALPVDSEDDGLAAGRRGTGRRATMQGGGSHHIPLKRAPCARRLRSAAVTMAARFGLASGTVVAGMLGG